MAKKKKKGRPPKNPNTVKSVHLDLRIDEMEKQAFKGAADIAGLSLSAWIRTRLRGASRKELEGNNIPVPFLDGHTLNNKSK